MLDILQSQLSRWGLAVVAVISLSVWFAATPDSAEAPQLLFVQSANDIAVTDDQLRLKNVGPTLFFSDRPKRIAGHFKLDEWQKLWTEGRDSMVKDPPNAVLSVFEPGKDGPSETTIELVDMKVDGTDLVYSIKVLKGSLPAAGGQSSLFIDDVPLNAPGLAGVLARDCYNHGCAP